MRAVYPLVALAFTVTPASAGEFPSALSERLTQGVKACVAYYANGTDLSSLTRHGFSAVSDGAEITLTKPATPSTVNVRTFTEGRNKAECETHANYVRSGTIKNAYNLTMATVMGQGFQPKVKHHYNSKAKTIFARGENSMFMKIRTQGNTLMIKFKRRTP